MGMVLPHYHMNDVAIPDLRLIVRLGAQGTVRGISKFEHVFRTDCERYLYAVAKEPPFHCCLQGEAAAVCRADQVWYGARITELASPRTVIIRAGV